MEQKHRDIIRQNRTRLVNDITDLASILDDLMTDKIITDSMSQDILAKKTPNEKTRKLLDILAQRGPKAFRRFCEALMNTQQDHIVEILDPEFYRNSVRTAKPVSSDATSAGGDTSLARPKDEHPKSSIPQPVSVPIVPGKQKDERDKHIPNEFTSKGPDTKNEKPKKDDLPTASPSKTKPVQPIPSEVTSETVARKNKNSNRPMSSSSEPSSLPNPNIFPGQAEGELPETAKDWPKELNLRSNTEFKVKKLTGNIEDLDKYSLEGKRTCIVVANQHYTERYKTRLVDIDRLRIKNVLKELNFNDITIHTNKSSQQLLSCLEEERQKISKETSVLMLIVTSYGANGQIFCVDGDKVSLQQIVDIFSVENCPLLKGKPKVVLIHAGGFLLEDGSSPSDTHCNEIRRSLSHLSLGTPTSKSKGFFSETVSDCRPQTLLDDSQTVPTAPTPESKIVLSPSGILDETLNVYDNSDFLVAIATGPDEDHPHYCSLFLLATLYVLCRYSHQHHFLDMLNKVNRLKKDASGQLVEICKCKSSLTKNLYLQP
ncbi:uncharacterized protein LOC127881434 [Dreissena polymorpha]|uniref:Uncharacterized protein n=1 Tax=Dreissena polymorpha TaxID=45954 RepID=A0A9D4K0M9_DREPO|nr:uncharacterized protein LOC127881434 [Dreissena polymorpha]XP_052285286.1 uncharacterized protein LOC127881434 [Dreissena polymorpha]KAH3827043.1 hypothetical protein DPMN_128971 [Dreissena polymorpha]